MIKKIASLFAKIRLYGIAALLTRLCVRKKEFKFNAKVINIYRERKNECGGYVGLNVSSDICTEAMNEAGIYAKSVGVPDSNGVDRVLFTERPSHLVIKAFWIPKEKLELLARKYPSCKFVVVCHSKPSFLGQEGKGLSKFIDAINLSRELPNVIPACNNRETAEAFSTAYGADIAWAPNVMPDIDIEDVVPKSWHPAKGALNVGMFCAIRPFKNVLNQAVAATQAAADLGVPLRFHVISDRVEMDGDRSLENLRLFFATAHNAELIEHKWLPHGDFLDLVAEMDAGMQASFTESFNIVSYDFLISGVPVVASTAIEWAPDEWKANPDSIRGLTEKLKEVTSLRDSKEDYYFGTGVRHLNDYNYDAIAQWSVLLAGAKTW